MFEWMIGACFTVKTSLRAFTPLIQTSSRSYPADLRLLPRTDLWADFPCMAHVCSKCGNNEVFPRIWMIRAYIRLNFQEAEHEFDTSSMQATHNIRQVLVRLVHTFLGKTPQGTNGSRGHTPLIPLFLES